LVEAYALLCGLSIAKEANIGALSIFGDPMIIIKEMIHKSTPKRGKLKTIISIIKQELSSFVKVSIFLIKKDLNTKEDLWAKHMIELSPRTLV
jgi:hypothetical protein